MHIDLVIPTYNRVRLLERTLQSILDAEQPADLALRVVVVDNNSSDTTAALVREYQARFAGRLEYVFEARPGRSNAINAGIRAFDGELVGMIDDDEEIDRRWLTTVRDGFADPRLDFIGGPCLPRWGAEPPAWLTKDRPAVVGWIEGGTEVRDFGTDPHGILMGGNAVVRRALLERVGLYVPELGRSGDRRLMSGEDREMYERLLGAGARGQFRPDLVIHHFVPPERMTKAYHRRWVFWHGVSIGLLDRTHRQAVTYLAGVPRYMLGDIVRGLRRPVTGWDGGEKGERSARWFAEELRLRDLAGFIWGKFLYRVPREVTAPAGARAGAGEVASEATPDTGATPRSMAPRS